jgi:hypothetical protein
MLTNRPLESHFATLQMPPRSPSFVPPEGELVAGSPSDEPPVSADNSSLLESDGTWLELGASDKQETQAKGLGVLMADDNSSAPGPILMSSGGEFSPAGYFLRNYVFGRNSRNALFAAATSDEELYLNVGTVIGGHRTNLGFVRGSDKADLFYLGSQLFVKGNENRGLALSAGLVDSLESNGSTAPIADLRGNYLVDLGEGQTLRSEASLGYYPVRSLNFSDSRFAMQPTYSYGISYRGSLWRNADGSHINSVAFGIEGDGHADKISLLNRYYTGLQGSLNLYAKPTIPADLDFTYGLSFEGNRDFNPGAGIDPGLRASLGVSGRYANAFLRAGADYMHFPASGRNNWQCRVAVSQELFTHSFPVQACIELQLKGEEGTFAAGGGSNPFIRPADQRVLFSISKSF